MKLSKRVAAILACVLMLCVFAPCALAAEVPEYSTTYTGTVVDGNSKIYALCKSNNGSYYMESVMTSIENYNGSSHVDTVNLVCGDTGYVNGVHKYYSKTTAIESTFTYTTYYDGTDTYTFYSLEKGNKFAGNWMEPYGQSIIIPQGEGEAYYRKGAFAVLGSNYKVGTTTINGSSYYSESGSRYGSGTITYCFEDDTLKYIIYELSRSDGTVSTYIHEVKVFSTTCDESSFVLPEGFPNSMTWTVR